MIFNYFRFNTYQYSIFIISFHCGGQLHPYPHVLSHLIKISFIHHGVLFFFYFRNYNRTQMECCSDGTVEKDTSFRVTIKESRQKEPLKFQLLSAIGLREYLIERFIFSRGQPGKRTLIQSTISSKKMGRKCSLVRMALPIRRSTLLRPR